MKRLAILGSTGSIGRQTLEVVRAHRERLQVVGLAAGRNVGLLLEQATEFDARLLATPSPIDHLPPSGHLLPLEEMASHPKVDLVMVATSGSVGLLPTIRALEAGKEVALANKEALVMAGHHIMALARNKHIELRPVDSEPSAIWQCLRGEAAHPSRLILTASGGAFRDRSPAELEMVRPQEALHHPTWRMGRKVTIDSATLMNKGMEVIEAHWLFDVPIDRIDILIHRESIIHSLVEFSDGSIKAQLSPPDMRLPIQYALSHPERWRGEEWPHLDLAQMGRLHFEAPDFSRFPCLKLALEAGERGGSYPTVLAAADEVAVERFLSGDIGFMDIPRVLEATLSRHDAVSNPSIDEVLDIDAWAREQALAWQAG